MDSVTANRDGNQYSLLLKLPDKSIILSFKTAWETDWWLNGIRRALETEREVSRTVQGVLKYNVATLYFFFASHMDKEIERFVKGMFAALTLDLNAEQFAKALKEAGQEFGFLSDAFYARKPFVPALFRYIVLNFHQGVRKAIESYWNKFLKILQTPEILQLASALNIYEKSITFWGVVDRNFVWAEKVINTLMTRLFESSKEPITNILYDLDKKTYVDNNKIYSSSCPALESHIFFLLSHFQHVPINLMAERLTVMSSNLLFTFFINALILVRRETYESQIMIALLNNNFLKIIKNFAKKVHTDTKSQLSLKYIRTLVNEYTLIQLLNDFETAVMKKLIKKFRKEVKQRFEIRDNILNFDINKAVQAVNTYFSPLLRLCGLEIHVNTLYCELFDKFLSLYYGQFIDFCDRVDQKNHRQLQEKVDRDFKSFARQMENLHFDGYQRIQFKLGLIKKFVDTDDMDEALTLILNMQVFYKKIGNPKISEKLLRAKVYFPPNAIAFISNYITKSIEEDSKQKLVRASLSKTFFNPYVYHFIYKLSKLIRKCSQAKTRAGA